MNENESTAKCEPRQRQIKKRKVFFLLANDDADYQDDDDYGDGNVYV